MVDTPTHVRVRRILGIRVVVMNRFGITSGTTVMLLRVLRTVDSRLGVVCGLDRGRVTVTTASATRPQQQLLLALLRRRRSVIVAAPASGRRNGLRRSGRFIDAQT
jgi:hypothetical protein